MTERDKSLRIRETDADLAQDKASSERRSQQELKHMEGKGGKAAHLVKTKRNWNARPEKSSNV